MVILIVHSKFIFIGLIKCVWWSLFNLQVASPSIESFSTLPEAEGSLNLCDEPPDLIVRIDSPEKHFDLLDTYILFRVTTKTSRPEFKFNNYCVKRRYNDFVWLRNNLVAEYPTHFVPVRAGSTCYTRSFNLTRFICFLFLVSVFL